MATPLPIMNSVPLAPFFWGVFVSAILYGFTTFQALTFLRVYKRDPLLQKLCVLFIWVLDSLQLGVVAQLIYYSTYEVEIIPSSPVPWSLPIFLLLHKILLSMIQACYILRIWRLRPKQIWLPAMLMVTVLSNFVLGVYLSTTLFRFHNVGILIRRQSKIAVTVNLASYSITDILIAGSLMYILAKARTNLTWTESSWVMLFAYLLNTGIIVGVISFLRILSFTVFNRTVFALEAALSKFYVLCFIAMLNARVYLQDSKNDTAVVLLTSEDQNRSPYPTALTINEVGFPLFPGYPSKTLDVENIQVKVDQEFSSKR